MDFLGDKRSICFQLILVLSTTIIASCNSSDQKPVSRQTAMPAKTVLTEPFRFHKTIEVSPGNIYDIFSWGRGSGKTGSFLILASDSAEAKYTTTTGDLDGAITDVYNTDMDMDGNPEILIQAKSKDSTAQTQIYAFEYKDHKAQKLDFPKLNQSQKKGYRGGDNFYIKEGILMREFPVFEGKGDTAKVTGDKRILEYGIRNNNFTVKTVSQDNGDKKQSAVADTAKKSTSTVKKPTSENTRRKKHHVLERRHHSSKKITGKKSRSSSSKKHRRHRD